MRPSVLFVGAFPPPDSPIVGGMVTSCRVLMGSSLPQRVDLDLLDSTQVSNPIPSLPVRTLLAARRLIRYVVQFERGRPDVVLLFTAIGGSLLEKGVMAWYARMRGTPAVLFPRGGGLMDECRRSRWTRRWVRWMFGGAAAVFCQSQSWHKFAATTLGFAAENAPVIGNWTASTALLQLGRRRVASEGKPLRLLFLGWVDREKGVAELLQAIDEIGDHGSLRLNIVGEGSFSGQARALVQERKLDDIVTFHGWLHGSALLEIMAASDVLVLPSWAEGLPNAMIESMAAGLAVVVSAVGGVPDVATHGENALLVPPRDVSALREALIRVRDDADLRRRLARGGFTLAEQQFGVERAVDLMVHELRRIAGTGRRHPASGQLESSARRDLR